MSILVKPYVLSIWDEGANETETQIGILGSNQSQSQSRALEPKLIRNTSGQRTFSFYVYYEYKDNITGELTTNPYVAFLTNERKLKLEYDGKIYNFLIKSVKKDSSKKQLQIECTDQYVTELSKNGYGITLDAELNNNYGTITELADKVLNGSRWSVDKSNSIGLPDMVLDDLVEVAYDGSTVGGTVQQFINNNGTYGLPTMTEIPVLPSGTYYACYSSCRDNASVFSLFTAASANDKDGDGNIINNSNQYCIIDARRLPPDDLGYILPPGFTLMSTFTGLKGYKYQISPIQTYNSLLDKYVTKYQKGTGDNALIYYGYSQTETVDPVFVTELTTNGNNPTSASGWRAMGYKERAPKLTVKTARKAEPGYYQSEWVDDAVSASGASADGYDSYLHWDSSDLTYSGGSNLIPILTNSGPYDHRTTIENFAPGRQYRLHLDYFSDKSFKVCLGVFDDSGAYYTVSDVITVDSLTWADSAATASSLSPKDGTLTIIDGYDKTPADFEKTRYCLMITPTSVDAVPTYIDIFKCQLYESISKLDDKGKTVYLTPYDTVTNGGYTHTVYRYYAADNLEKAASLDALPITYESTTPWQDVTSVTSIEKHRTISAKESNRFNILQSLCEKFECWMEIDGETQTVKFLPELGKKNYAGFRYGVNLKSISRSDDSKSFVTKLIVKDNHNEFGEDGFCSIARAPSNAMGNNIVYDMSYYLGMGLLNADAWNDFLYTDDDTGEGKGCIQHYAEINYALTKAARSLARDRSALVQLESAIKTQTALKEKYTDECNDAIYSFKQIFGYEYNEINTDARKTEQKNHPIYLNRIYLAQQGIAQAVAELDRLGGADILTAYQDRITDTQATIVTQQTVKAALDATFQSKFARYIQEGTWISEDYIDDEKYYIDALNVARGSAVPHATYTISVLELSQLPGYEQFTFALGDRTTVEDSSFFGTDKDGVPIRTEVVLTEITNYLDSPSKDSIKVQNYRNPFQDLFKKVGATVQTVKYNSGGYDNAASLAAGSINTKLAFLSDALSDASNVFRNLGDQSVTWGRDGISILDGASPNNALRITNQGIALTTDGGESWRWGLTADGISANLITAGQIDTSKLRILAGDDEKFRWDAVGLTAYGETANKGVRFDRFGMYGFTLNEGENAGVWSPNSTEAIKEKSAFALTWDGLHVKATDGEVDIGKYAADGSIATSSTTDPVVIRAGKSKDNKYPFELTASGNCTLKGNITANTGFIGTWNITEEGLSCVFDDTDWAKKYNLMSGVKNPRITILDGASYSEAARRWLVDNSTSLFSTGTSIVLSAISLVDFDFNNTDIFNNIFYLGTPLSFTGYVDIQNLVTWAQDGPSLDEKYQDSLMDGYTLPCTFKCEGKWYDGIIISNGTLALRQIYWDAQGWRYNKINIESGSWPENDNGEFIGKIYFYDEPEQNAALKWLFNNSGVQSITTSPGGSAEVEDGYICALGFKGSIDDALFSGSTLPQIYSQGFQVGNITYYGIQFTENEIQYKATSDIEIDDWITVYSKASQSWTPLDSSNGNYQFIKFKATDDLNLEIPVWLYNATLLASPLQITNINTDVNDNGEPVLRIDTSKGFTILLSNFDENSPLNWDGDLPIGWYPSEAECPSLDLSGQYIEPQMPIFCPKNQLTIKAGKTYTLDTSPASPETECSVTGSIEYNGNTYTKILMSPKELTLSRSNGQALILYNAPHTGNYRVTLSSKISERLNGESPILNIEHKLKTESDNSYQTITKITANGAFQQIQESPSAIYLAKAESSEYQSQITASGKTEYGNATKLKLLSPQKGDNSTVLSLSGPFYEDASYKSLKTIRELFSLTSNGEIHARDVILHLPNGGTKKLSTLSSSTGSTSTPDLDATTNYIFNCGSSTELID